MVALWFIVLVLSVDPTVGIVDPNEAVFTNLEECRRYKERFVQYLNEADESVTVVASFCTAVLDQEDDER